MDRVDIKVGFTCNNSCKFCVQGHKKKKFSPRTTEELAGILKEARENYEAVVFTGGEVTVRKDVFDLVSTARDLGFKTIHIQSNGRLFFYKKFCRQIIQAGATEFGLALHGHIPELHDYLTNSPDSFRHTAKGIKNLTDMGQRVLTNTVITKSNYRHLPELAHLLVNLGVIQYQFAFPHILGAAEINALSIAPRKSLIKPFVFQGLDVGIASDVNVMTEAIPYCFMSGYEAYLAESVIPDTKIYDADSIIENFTHTRITQGKAKGPPCRDCAADSICEGPWREYPELFGWDEFKPLARKPIINRQLYRPGAQTAR